MKKITIICSRLDLPGGIERAVVNTANLLQSKGQQVTLLVLDETPASFYPLNPAIQVHYLPLHFGITEKGNSLQKKLLFLQHIRLLRKQFAQLQPDVIIGTEYQLSIAAYLAARKAKTKIFAWEHHHFYWLHRSRFWQALFRKIYPKLTAVICLNPTEKALFEKIGCRTTVIPNFIEKGAKASLQSKTLLTVGWLIKRKGVDLIPTIAEKIFRVFPDWQWIIIGTGPEEEALVIEIHERGLDRNISIVKPSSPDLYSYYQNASLYVMTSRFECFPMVLLEAKAHGVPCVSFNCQSGPSYIIQHNRNGFLIEENNIDAMVEAIIQLLTNEEERKTFGTNAYKDIEQFSPDVVYALWEKLLAE
jgi:glycosyltransferase involved in cell wall biosynthesis